ncbi:hypothetical protein DdX_13525 [Ditylenchus destructor]|uniref:Uncharacterized protein n=1 Tax=Ditylenchus destructor TaxID=166010 RepID=A0AAD4MSQ7_9BILA|nr:hypothetical protein DdX_13525 [Ditylenchus destructor]
MGNTFSILPRWREKLPRTKVIISDDCWIDVLKFLTCAQWFEKRFISSQINGMARRNISHLPREIYESAILGEDYPGPKLRQVVNDAIVAFGVIIPQSKLEQWFVNRGISLECRVKFHMPIEAIPIEKVLLGKHSDYTDMCILGPARQNGSAVVFYSQFCQTKKFSWASLDHFLTFLFHPLTYVKKVEMFAVDQKFIDAVKEKIMDNSPTPGNTMHPQKCIKNRPLYIHCETFSLLYKTGMSVQNLRDILTWLQRNVRADSLRMSSVGMISGIYAHSPDSDAVCRIMTNFVFGSLRICAKRELRIRLVIMTNLLNSLVQEFWTLPQIEREIPMIVLELFFTDVMKIVRELGPKVIHQEVDSQGVFLYVFENGTNRMRISFCEMSDNPCFLKLYECSVKFYAL